jgi:dienelactone hydrolase
MGDVAVITPEQQAAFTMYSTTGQNTDGPMTQKAVTDNFVEVKSGSPDSDLNITDENGHVLARFENGDFRVKNFNTSKVKIETGNGDNSSDLDITDEKGHVLARFQNGNIKTKYFNSRKYADMPSGGYENFLVQVNGYIADNNSTTGNLQDSVSMEYDRCIINLPPNYNPVGEPVRLVIAGQGSSGQIQSSPTKAYWTMPLADTILSEGYAVMQVNGTLGYTDGIASYGGMGTPQYLQSVIAAYNYVINKYNIKKDGVFLSGWSQGTLKTWQIAANLQCFIPVKAAVFFGFAVDLWKGLYANFPQTAREYMTENFGFVEKEANKYVLEIFSNIYSAGDTVTKPTTYSSAKTVPTDYEFAYILNNYDKWLGYDPICWGTSKNIISEQFRYRSWVADSNPNEDLCFQDVANIVPCPTKIFVGTSDTSTPLKIANWYKTMADNAGVLCDLRIYQGGNHNYPTSYQTIQVSTRYGGNITTNIPSWEGMLFLERYDY